MIRLSDLCSQATPPPKTVKDADGAWEGGETGIHYQIDPGLGREEFRITVDPSGVEVLAGNKAGRIYAAGLVSQLRRIRDGEPLPCGTIHDYPDLDVRGLMIDVSRCRVPTRETLTGIVDFMCSLRLNHLELYTEHTFAYSNHRAIWVDSSPITHADIGWLETECENRAIELVPNQNSFGHLRRWLSHPDYAHLAEAPEGFTDPWGTFRDYPFSLAPGPESLEFLEGLYDELLPLFSSPNFNAGLDETFDLGQGRSAERCREVGIGRVYLDFILEIERRITGRGKTMLFWGDIVQNHPELIPELPRDAVAIEWGYEADHPFDERCKRLAAAGIRFLAAPGTSSWNSITGRLDVSCDNVSSAIGAVRKHGGEGILMTDWGDGGHVQQFPVFIYPIAFAASRAWAADHEPDLAGYLSRERFADQSGSFAESLRRLGHVHRHLAPVPNGTLLGVSLVNFGIPRYHDDLHSGFVGADEIREELQSCRDLVAASQPACSDGTTLKEEVLLTADLADLSLDLLQLHRNTSRELPSWVPTRLDELEVRHRDLWTRRFRPGGLDDSVQFLRAIEGHYEGGRQ